VRLPRRLRASEHLPLRGDMTGELTLFDLPAETAQRAPAGEMTLAGGRVATPQQRDAVERRSGSLLLTATAGSGKTAVLVERFVRAVLDDEVSPARILAITFTDKAAGELRDRVRQRFLECGAREAARETEAAFISTIHGFCARLLRSHALAAGLDPRFTVLDEAQATSLRDEAFDAALEQFVARGEAALDLVAAYSADRLAGMVASAYDPLRSRGERDPRLPEPAPRDFGKARVGLGTARDALLAELRGAGAEPANGVAAALDACERLLDAETAPPPGAVAAAALGAKAAGSTDACTGYAAAVEELKRACADHHGAIAVGLIADLLALFGAEYRARKRARSAVDFDDLELEAAALVAGDAAIRAEWAERFELMMVDEFQDTNPRQLALLSALERDNLFCVGDAMQSIYGFRDADVGLFHARRDELAERGAALSLTESFRARPEIVEAVNAAFGARLGDAFVELEPARADPAPDADPRVELLLTDTEGWEDHDEMTALGPTAASAKAWRRAEAKLLAQRVADLVADGTPVGEIAVLLRASGDLHVYERALEERGLPAVSSSGGGFWMRLEVLDLLAYLALVANPLDEHALYSVLASPLVGVSPDALAVIATTAHDMERGAWWAVEEAFGGDGSAGLADRLGEDDRPRLAGFAAWMRDERTRAPRLALAGLLARAMAATGYEAGLRAAPGGPRRVRNVEKLLHLARAYEDEHGRDLRGFLDFAAARTRTPGSEVEAPLPEGEEAAIRVMTIHAAKGLEFDVVCVADLGRAPSQQAPDLLVEDGRVGVRVVMLDGRGSVPGLAHDELREARAEADAQEEDRILFVALTRPRERLILSGGVDFAKWPKPSRTAPPIGWLACALVADVAERVTGEAPVFDAAPQEGGRRTAIRVSLNAPATLGTVLMEPAPEEPPPQPSAGTERMLEPEPPVSVAGTAARDPAAILSYSSLAAYARCGYRYYLERELGLPERPATDADAPRTGLDARTRGVLVHEVLEQIDFAAPVGTDAATIQVVARGQGIELSARDAAGVAALVAGFATSDLCARLARASESHREREFTFPLAGRVLVTGVIDVLAWEREGRALVVDYKSDAVGDADLEAVVGDLYDAQRRLYALAALRAGAQAVEVAYCFLERPGEPVVARFEAGDAGRLERGLRDLAGGLLRGEFPVTDTPHKDLCLTCPGRRALCSWPEAMTLRAL
jgi:ATP-dependent helicase/nuclease subunit A